MCALVADDIEIIRCVMCSSTWDSRNDIKVFNPGMNTSCNPIKAVMSNIVNHHQKQIIEHGRTYININCEIS